MKSKLLFSKTLPLLILGAGFTLSTAIAETRVARELPCAWGSHDNNIFAAGLGHNSFDSFYRSPFGAVPSDQGNVTLRFRTCRNDAEEVRIRLWDSVARKEIWLNMTRDPSAPTWDGDLGTVEHWKADISVPMYSTMLFYFFEIRDGASVHYYVRNIPAWAPGGWGRYSSKWDDLNTFQLNVYNPHFKVADWLKGRVIYQIFPDRFRNGDTSNDPAEGSGFVFGKQNHFNAWNKPICDPRTNDCPLQRDNQFYGGDLQGVVEKIDYIKSLGVGAIYFNPIFLSATNHRYDTQDYTKIDTKLGTMETFRTFVKEAHSRDLKVILDGVYNHGSADSPYFDVFRRWDTQKQNGACEDFQSPYRSWFSFPHYANRPIDHARPGTYYYCEGPDSTLITYESWWGYYEHPVFNKKSQDVLNYFYAGGPESIARRWIREGVDGWRLDVASDVAPGEGIDPSQNYWQEFRKAIHIDNPNAIMVGEEWANASQWLLGREWDSVTNYRFRTAIMNWLSDGCTGLGCTNDVFEDDDNNWQSSNGPLRPTSVTEFEARLRTIFENYPKETWNALMNPLGSHDTQRALFTLKKISRDNEELAVKKLRFASLFQFTFPGSPVVLYGDEAAVRADGKFHEGRWLKDPYSRVVYPWEDQGLKPNKAMIAHFSKLGQLRSSNPALRIGEYEPLLVDDAKQVFAFQRVAPTQQAFVVLNRKNETQTIELPLRQKTLPDGTRMKDLMTGQTAIVQGGILPCGSVAGLDGQIWVPTSSVQK